MAPAVERKGHIGQGLSERSISPVKSRPSPQQRNPPRRERSPATRRRSSPRTRSPKRDGSLHRKSPAKEKAPERARSPKHSRGRSPSRSPSPRYERGSEKTTSKEEGNKRRGREFKGKRERTSSSRSPSPRSKRLMRAQGDREGDKIKEREERVKERHGERREDKDAASERRSNRDKTDCGPSRSSRRDRSISPEERNHRRKHDSRSPSRSSRAGAREEASKSRADEQYRDGDVDSIAMMNAAEESLEAKEKDKQKPSFELSGKLAEETNRVRGVTLLFNEPADARKPNVRWRLYVFKAGEVLNEPLYVHRQSCYLFGRERRVADIPTDHPSCSKQHAVIQYRLVEKEQPDGLMSKQIRPYIMDLGSTNGTFINDNRVEPQRYYELFEKDTIRFGNSSREYVILHENSIT